MQCNRENMTKLVEALESGEYEQAQNQLRQGDHFCCLGVASDLAVKDGIGHWEATGDSFLAGPHGDGYAYVSPDGLQLTGLMSKAVSDWLGLDYTTSLRALAFDVPKDDPDYENIRSGVAMNDSGKSFTEIAAAIRRDYLS